MKEVQLTLTVQQAQATAKALDLFARLSIGQIGMIAEMVAMDEIPMYAPNESLARHTTPEICETIREKIGEILHTMGYSGFGHSLGIGNKHVSLAGNRTYEISRVLKKALAEHQDPNPKFRGVDYDGLSLRYTNDPLPVAQIVTK